MAGRGSPRAYRENAAAFTAVRYGTAQGPLQRLRVQYDALRAAYRGALRVAENRGDTELAARVERVVEDAANALAEATGRARNLRERDAE